MLLDTPGLGCGRASCNYRGLGVAMTHAAIYARVSDKSESNILFNQIQASKAYCEKLEWSYELFPEVASGANVERTAFVRLMERVRKRHFDVVIFTSLSRMTRGGIGEALYILNELERFGTGWNFIDQPILNKDSGTPPLARDIILAVLAAVDKDYRRNISEKTKAAFARKRALDPNWRGPGRPRKNPIAQGASDVLEGAARVFVARPKTGSPATTGEPDQ